MALFMRACRRLGEAQSYSVVSLISIHEHVLYAWPGAPDKGSIVRDPTEDGSAYSSICGLAQFKNICRSFGGSLPVIRVCPQLLILLGDSSNIVRTVISDVCILFQRFLLQRYRIWSFIT